MAFKRLGKLGASLATTVCSGVQKQVHQSWMQHNSSQPARSPEEWSSCARSPESAMCEYVFGMATVGLC